MANHFPNLRTYSSEELLELTTQRAGEKKLGETVLCPQASEPLSAVRESRARFVVLGIKEDIGIRANLGIGGASECWDHALTALLNVQSNQFLNGGEILILGSLEFPDLLVEAKGLKPADSSDLKKLRALTETVDSIVAPLVEAIVAAGKIPIIIGGGHNNSYGNLRGSSQALGQAISCINIDPHADYRALEGRHSGNGFSYAREQGYLGRYAIFGLHEGYNSDQMIATLDEDPNIQYSTFESLLVTNPEKKHHTFVNLLNWCGLEPIGLELDLDALTAFPVSALNPSGFTLNEVRSLITTTAALRAPLYLHLCEGSPGRAASEPDRQMLAKSIAYLICDFIKAHPRY